MRKESNNEFELKHKSYIKSVDGLRAICVSFVMLYHLMPHVFAGGYLGVLVFFVLSGYFITENLLASFSQEKEFRFSVFYKARFSKIYMTYLPFLCIVSFVVLGFFHEALHRFLPNVISSLTGWNNLYQIINGLSYFETHGVLNPFTHLWFMGVELQFYLFFPLILFVLFRWSKGSRSEIGFFLFLLSGVSAAVMFLNYSPEKDISRIYYGTDTRAFSLLIGAYVACLFPKERIRTLGDKTWKNVLYSLLSLVLLSAMIWAMFVLDAQTELMYPFGMYLFSLAAAMLLLLLMIQGNAVASLLSVRLFSYLGLRSFSLYLWQYAVMVFVNAQFMWIAIDPIHLVALNLAITLVISEISYQLFEKRKGLKYKKSNRVVLASSSLLMLLAIGLPIYLPERFEAQDNLSDLKRVIQEVEEAKIADAKPMQSKKTETHTSEVMKSEAQVQEEPNKNINQIIEESQTQDDMMKKIFEEDERTKRKKEEERERELQRKRELRLEEEKRKELERQQAQAQEQHQAQAQAQDQTQSDPVPEDEKLQEVVQDQAQEQVQEQPQEAPKVTLKFTFIGDSVMLGSKPNIEKAFPNSVVNAKVSRQAHSLSAILQDMESRGQLYDNVVIHLGTNGSIDKQQLIRALQSIGDRKIYLINAVVPRSWESQVNQVIREVAAELPNVEEIDWHGAAKGKRELFYKDATHPELIGREKYTELIRNAVN